MGPRGTRMGPGATHKDLDLDGLRWKNMGAGCTSPGPSALLSAVSGEVDLCGNCDKCSKTLPRIKGLHSWKTLTLE